MKGILGLCVAAALGIAGALFNFAYLAKKAAEVDNVIFIGIKPDVVINRGEALQADHLTQVPIPLAAVGNLKDFAILWSQQRTVLGNPIWRTLSGPRLLLSEDIKTAPPEQLTLAKDERAMFVNIDTRSFVPSLLCPGDKVMFLVPRSLAGGPTPAVRPTDASAAGDQGEEPANPAAAASRIRAKGPFRVLAVGNRLGSAEVMRAAKMSQLQENVIVIRVNEKDLAEKKEAEDLYSILDSLSFRPVGVQIYEQAPRQREMP